MATITAKITGTKKLANALRRYGKAAPQALAKELYTEGEYIKQNAETLTPVDTGALKLSARNEVVQIKGDRVSGLVGFGGPAAPYALYVHEDMNARHEVGQAKFLETAVNIAAPGMSNRIAGRLRRSLKARKGN